MVVCRVGGEGNAMTTELLFMIATAFNILCGLYFLRQSKRMKKAEAALFAVTASLKDIVNDIQAEEGA